MPKEHIKKNLQLTYPPEALQRWYDPLILEFDGTTHILYVRFPHLYFESWFKQQGQQAFEQAFSQWRQMHMPKASLHYCSVQPSLPRHFAQLGGITQQNFSINADFASFITNSKNAFPLAAAREVANPQSTHTYNPFLVCGKSGTGKTHILRAIAAERAKQPSAGYQGGGHIGGLFCGSADQLEELFALQPSPAHILSAYTCFVVDDLQRLAHRDAVQEQLVKFMDACMDSRPGTSAHPIQLVFACTDTLASLEGISEALRSRLEMGLVVELKNADLDVRMRYAQKRCAEFGIKADRSQMLLLAQRCTQLRQLSGIILKIQAFHDLVQRDITLGDLENILRNTGDDRQTLPADIVSTVAQYTGHKAEDILGSKRKPDLVMARQTSMYLCRELLGTSYPVLGRFFGGKDHSTVIYSIQKIKKLLDSNKDAQYMVTELKQRCQGR